MAIIGYAAALEQFHPNELLRYSQLAEQHGFKGVMAADHFQPWVPQQGHNAFVWAWMSSLLGAGISRRSACPWATGRDAARPGATHARTD